MSVFRTNLFNGGMNNYLAPELLEENMACNLINADISNGKICAMNNVEKIINKTPIDVGHVGNKNRSVVKWYERYYWSENNNNIAPFYGGDVEDLGIPYPSTHPALSLEDDGSLTGNFKYCWCYVNENGWESAPCRETGDLWVEQEATNQNIIITAPDSFPENISYIKVYRTTNNGADFYYLGSIEDANGTFVDDIDDTYLMMCEQCDTFDNYPPLDKGKYLTEYGGVFFLAIGSKLYFSRQNNPHAWPTLNFIGFDDVITGIAPEFQGVLVFTANHTYRVTGAEDIQTLVKALIPGNQGCNNYRTISQVANAPIWLSNDGICLWDGESVVIVSQQKIDTRFLQVNCAVSANDVYYLFLLDETICFDRRNGDIFYKLNFSCEYAWYESDSDKVLMQNSDGLFSFDGVGKLQFTYLSPYIGDTKLSFKKFYEIMVFCSDKCSLRVWLDKETCLALDINYGGRHRIKLPFGTVGKYLQVQIQSYGILDEIAVFYE